MGKRNKLIAPSLEDVLGHACLSTREGDAVTLLGVTFSAHLRGVILEACVAQRFANPTDHPLEVVYSFPLPWGAVLLGVDVVLGERSLTGAVVAKRQAETRYEDALADGDAAIMLERNHDDSYSLNLGNLAAGERCTITLRYAQTLQFEQHSLRVLIPTVIAPRYGDAEPPGGLMPHQVPSHRLTVEYPFELCVHLHGELSRSRVASPSHRIGVAVNQDDAEQVLTVSLARSEYLDRDFVLVIDQLAQDSLAIAAKDKVEPEGVAVLASFCPHLPPKQGNGLAVKILVDCSGSMAGDSIAAAKRALQAIVQKLDGNDRFALSRFGSSVRHRSRALWKTTETTRLAAQRWVGALEADLGGTEMEAALSSTFQIAQDAGSDVLLVTDGQISAIDDTIALAQASGHRVFVVGIGSSPAESHLRRLAQATGGACDFVAPGEAVEPAVVRMFTRLRSARLSEVTLEWPQDVPPLWVSPLQTSVFDGDALSVYALLPHHAAGEIRLCGRVDDEPEPQEISRVSIPENLADTDTASRLVASARIQSLPRGDRQIENSKATALAEKYQLVTPYTNFLLVHERAEADKARDMPTLQKVAQMMPAGWGGLGSVQDALIVANRPGISFLRRDVGTLATPSVWRSASGSRPPLRMSVSHFADMDETDDLHARRQTLDLSNERYWSKTEHYTGLTPLGVCEWLRITPEIEWPTTYEGLRRMGLGAWVVEWLEFVAARNGEGRHPEAEVVRTFLALMAASERRAALEKGTGFMGALRTSLQKMRAMWGEASDLRPPEPDNEALFEAIATGLTMMTSSTWPEEVLFLD
jgi:Ca-activated chloride channel family protein